MLSAVISWVGILLVSLILFRGFQGKLLSKYRFFYTYSACVLAVSLPAYFIYGQSLDWYRNYYYWGAEFLTLVLGYGILLEIFKHVLSPYPGAERFARIAGLAVFGGIFCFALLYPLMKSQWSPSGSMVDFERDLRAVQAIFVCGLLCVISYYGIAMGKNMKGMILGYGVYIGTSLVSLALGVFAPHPFDAIANIIQPLSFDVSLVIWALALWSYCPNPIPDHSITLEADYEAFVLMTRRAVGTMRGHLTKAARQ